MGKHATKAGENIFTQYGLFLQAKKEDRMTILGNLLGLSVYGLMEQEAKKLLADTKRNLLSKKEAVKVKSEFVAEKGNPDGELENLEKEASEFDQIRKMTEQDIEVCKKQIADRKEAQDKSTELLQSTDTEKKALLSIQSEKEAAEKEMETCDVFLKNSEIIMAKAAEYEAAEETVKKLAPDVMEDTAVRAMVDSNLQRPNILPSEKAFAYRMKMEAMNHQGTSGGISAKDIGKNANDSARQVYRYIRLTI